MAGYKSLKVHDEREIKQALALMKNLSSSSASSKGGSSSCSCSDCADEDLQDCCRFSSESCYSDECSCSDCMDSEEDCGGTTCALAPKWMAESKSRSSRKKGKDSYCQGGVCPLVKKPKAKTKTKKNAKKALKKKPRAKKGKSPGCCCCSCR